MEVVTDFLFLGSKIIAGGDYGQEIRRYFLFGRKVITNLKSALKSRAKVCIVRAMVHEVTKSWA